MKLSTLLFLLLALALPARDILLYECTAERPPELDWKHTVGDVAMSAAAWPTAESGMTVKLAFSASPKGWPSGKFYLPEEMRDWRKAKSFRIEFFLSREGGDRMGVGIKSRKEKRNFSLSNYFYSTSTGRHTTVFDLSEVSDYDLSEIEYIDFYGSTPKNPLTLYVGEIHIEIADPEEDARERRDAAALLRADLDWRLALLTGSPELDQARTELLAALPIPVEPTEEEIVSLRDHARAAFAQADLAYVRAQAVDSAGIAALWCAPEEKVLRESYAFRAAPTTGEWEISAGRGEGESAQIAVYALRGQKAVKAEFVDAPKTADGGILPAECLKLSPMGYVETRKPCYPTEYIGYWPDPILEYLSGEAIEIEGERYQSWWLDLRVPHSQKPGLYRGTVRITTDTGEVALPYAVRVRSFELPDGAPYFSPTALDTASGRFTTDPADPDGRNKYWFAAAQLLLDNRLDPFDIYHPPTFSGFADHAKWYLAHGANACNLGFVNDEITDKQLAAYVANYRILEEAGLADKAAIYAYDECLPEKFEMIVRSLKKLRAAVPGVPIYATIFDASFGRDNGLDEVIDGWIPVTRTYNRNLDAIDGARARGEHVGWYVCISPPSPYANFLLDQPGNAPRLLMGFLAQKYKPEFFLYYKATVWRAYKDFTKNVAAGNMSFIQEPISGRPLMKDPWFGESFYDAPGDGRLMYPARTAPVPTQRLKLIRDGMDDWIYMDLLRKKLADDGAKHSPAWRAAAEKELQVEPEIAASATVWTTNPRLLQEKRERLAKLLEE